MWALVPWLNAGANLLLESDDRSAIWEQSRALVILNYLALSMAVVITLWGTGRIARRLETLRAATSKVLEGGVSEPFRELNNVVVPLIGAGATATAFALSTLLQDGWPPAILRERRGWSSASRSGRSSGRTPRCSWVSIVSDGSIFVQAWRTPIPVWVFNRLVTSHSWACGCFWRGSSQSC